MYGWLTNTGVKFVIVVDMEGRSRPPPGPEAGEAISKNINNFAMLGIRDADLRPAFKACHRAYVALMRNPFYEPEEENVVGLRVGERVGGMQITSPRFVAEMRRIGETWYPGIQTL